MLILRQFCDHSAAGSAGRLGQVINDDQPIDIDQVGSDDSSMASGSSIGKKRAGAPAKQQPQQQSLLHEPVDDNDTQPVDEDDTREVVEQTPQELDNSLKTMFEMPRGAGYCLAL